MVAMRLGRAASILGLLLLACHAADHAEDDDEFPEGWIHADAPGYTEQDASAMNGQGGDEFERGPGQGPLGTRSVTAATWGMETVGKQVMVVFLSPDDHFVSGFGEVWKQVAEPHELAAYTGLYEVDCVDDPGLCEKARKYVVRRHHIMLGTPSTNLSDLVFARPEGPMFSALAALTEKLGPVCSLADTKGCSKKDKTRIKKFKKKTHEQLNTEIKPLREKLAYYFERKNTWQEGADVLLTEIMQWQKKKRAAKLERAALAEACLPEAERQKKDEELGVQEADCLPEAERQKRDEELSVIQDAANMQRKSRVLRQRAARDLLPAFDAEWELLDKEVKSSDYNLLRMCLASKSEKKMSEEL